MVTVTPFHGPCSWIRQWDRAPDPIPTYLHGGPRATETAIISEVLRRHTRVQSIPRRGRGPVVSPCSYGICRTPVRKLKIRQRYVRKKTLPVTGKRVSSINIVSNFRAFLFFLSFFFFLLQISRLPNRSELRDPARLRTPRIFHYVEIFKPEWQKELGTADPVLKSNTNVELSLKSNASI